MLSYSIAQTRDKFTSIIHDVEKSCSVEVTRRGKPIAIILSIAEYQRLKGGRQNFWDACQQFRESTNWDEVDVGAETFEDVRDHSTGRKENPWHGSY